MSNIKEKPILFSTEMVQAILDGKKTQTRRVVKHTPRLAHDVQNTDLSKLGDISGFCPYGQKGDRLWVRETWNQDYGQFYFKADGVPDKNLGDTVEDFIWKPSIFMPREACRLILEITDVRAQRLQEISELDAELEGISSWHQSETLESESLMNKWCRDSVIVAQQRGQERPKVATDIGAFKTLWDSINGKTYPWNNNPWVWVISFKRVHENGNTIKPISNFESVGGC